MSRIHDCIEQDGYDIEIFFNDKEWLLLNYPNEPTTVIYCPYCGVELKG